MEGEAAVEEAAPAAAAADAALQEHTQQQQLDAEVLAASLMPMDLPMGPITARVFVADRQIQIDNTQDPPSLYALARKWVQNDPDLPQHGPTEPMIMLPQPAPALAVSPEPPAFPDDSEVYDPEEAVRALKAHWLAVRRFDQQQIAARNARYGERMSMLAAPGTLGGGAGLLPMGGGMGAAGMGGMAGMGGGGWGMPLGADGMANGQAAAAAADMHLQQQHEQHHHQQQQQQLKQEEQPAAAQEMQQ